MKNRFNLFFLSLWLSLWLSPWPAWSADPVPGTGAAGSPPGRGGFPPGARTFSNPYANTTTPPPPPSFPTNPSGPFGGSIGPGGNFEPEDDELDDDGPDFDNIGGPTNPRQPSLPTSQSGSSGSAGSGASGSSQKKTGDSSTTTVSAGGGPPAGVISTKKVQPIYVDDETGEGSKEIVTEFNFPDADIWDIAKTLGKLTGKNFIVDKEVKGKITIVSNSAITVGDAWRAFLTALDMNGLALIPSGKYIRIARQRDARDKQLRTFTGEISPDTDALITRVFPLKYIDAEEVARTFRSFVPPNSRIIPYEQTNTLIVTDTGSNIAKLSKMLELLDVEGYDVGIEVIPVRYASASELSKLIDTLIPGTGPVTAGAPPGGPRFGGGGGGRFSARRTKEGGVINTIIGDERTNTLIVNANSKGAEQVRELVAKLDQKLPAQAGGRVHVVYLKFADAEQVATTLNNLSSQAPSRPGIGGPPGGGTGINPVSASLFEGAIKASPDKATNSLVVTASPSDFATLQRVLAKLDIQRDQVFVEVIIMEVTIARDFDYSTNVIAPKAGLGLATSSKDLGDFIRNPLALGGAVFGFKSGQEFTVPLPDGTSPKVNSVMGLLKLLQSYSNANVLATPQIIALDNQEAKFESTERIPILKTTAVQGSGLSQQGVDFDKVGLSIAIKPQITKESNFINLKVTAKIGDITSRAVPDAVIKQANATLERSAETSAIVADADTIALGGLIRDKSSEVITKVPLLGDIPILGWLFKSKSTKSEKTNLLIFLTPHIVRRYDAMRAILDKKLQQRDNYVEKNLGGTDPQKDARDDIIRSLPDMNDILSQKAGPSSYTVDDENFDKSIRGGGSRNPNNAPPNRSEPRINTPQNDSPIPPVPPPKDTAGNG